MAFSNPAPGQGSYYPVKSHTAASHGAPGQGSYYPVGPDAPGGFGQASQAPYSGPPDYIQPVTGDVTTPPVQYQTTTPQFPGIPGLLATDPMYQELLSMDKAASAEDLATANRNMGQMRAYNGSDADPLTVLGRIADVYKQNLASAGAQMAARGMTSSGQTPFLHGRIDLSYQQQEFDARFKLQQYIQGIHDSLRAAARQRTMSEWQAQVDAVNRWLSDPTNQPTTVPYQPPDVQPAIPPDFSNPSGTAAAGDLGYYEIARQKADEG